MAKLVLAPILEPTENRVDFAFWMALQMAKDRDVARIADFF
jgi:hypothetical protein